MFRPNVYIIVAGGLAHALGVLGGCSTERMKWVVGLQWLTGYLRLALVFVWGGKQRGGFNFYSSGVFS